METFSLSGSSMGMVFEDLHSVKEVKAGHDSSRFTELNEPSNESGSNKQSIEKGSKRKKGKTTGNTKTSAAESGPDNQEYVPTKSKKNQRKGKDTSSLRVSDSKTGSKKESDKMKEDNFSIPEEWVMQKITKMVPDFEEQGLLSDLQVCAF